MTDDIFEIYMKKLITTTALPCFLLIGCGIDSGNVMNTPSLTEEVLRKDFFSDKNEDYIVSDALIDKLGVGHDIYFDDGGQGKLIVEQSGRGELLIKVYSVEEYDYPLKPIDENYSGYVTISATDDNKEIAENNNSATLEVYDTNNEGVVFEVYYLIEELDSNDCFTGSITYEGVKRKFNSSKLCTSYNRLY